MSTLSCESLHHLITHRLSRVETCDFQDKESCSLNGSNEFLKETLVLKYHSKNEIIFDSRGVALYLEEGNIHGNAQEFDENILNFKQFIGTVRSTIPIVEEEREPLKHLLEVVNYFLSSSQFKELVQSPSESFCGEFPPISTCFGHILSVNEFYPEFDPTTNFQEIFSYFDQLSHLRRLSCVL